MAKIVSSFSELSSAIKNSPSGFFPTLTVADFQSKYGFDKQVSNAQAESAIDDAIMDVEIEVYSALKDYGSFNAAAEALYAEYEVETAESIYASIYQKAVFAKAAATIISQNYAIDQSSEDADKTKNNVSKMEQYRIDYANAIKNLLRSEKSILTIV